MGGLMDKYKLGEIEKRFADMIWGNAPVQTRDLINLYAENFDWKRITTYTMLKRCTPKDTMEIELVLWGSFN